MTWISFGASYGALNGSIVIAGTALDSVRTPSPDTVGAFSAAAESGRLFAAAKTAYGNQFSPPVALEQCVSDVLGEAALPVLSLRIR